MKGKYELRGVSASKSEVHKAIKNLDKGLVPGAFCKVIPDIISSDPEKCLLMHADGAGTKTSLAYMYWKETGDLSVWKGIAQDSIVMNTDDLMAAGVTSTLLLSSTIGRNKYKIPQEVLSAIIDGTQEFIAEMESYGVQITNTGGETADIGDLVRTIVVDNTMLALERRENIFDNWNIKPGLVIVGLASFGKARYEKHYNGGMGSNGLTASRHDMFENYYANKYPEAFDPDLPGNLVFSGSKKLTQPVPEIPGLDFGKLVLSPTRTYAPVLLEVYRNLRRKIKGVIHCTGGGQTKILHFLKQGKVVKDSLFAPPPLFNHLKEESDTSWKEMYQVFNMGHRMELYCEPEAASEIIAISKSFQVDAKMVGRVVESDHPGLEVHDPEGNLISY